MTTAASPLAEQDQHVGSSPSIAVCSALEANRKERWSESEVGVEKEVQLPAR